MKGSLEERFWAKVRKTDTCWIWIGSKYVSGYGQIYANGKKRKASRVVWELTNGAIPLGLCVCHRCDNKTCVRPDHLFLGTSIDNTADRTTKGRTASGIHNGKYTHPEKVQRGEQHASSKLTLKQVQEIRAITRSPKERAALAKEYGVTPENVRMIAAYKSWKYQ